MSLHKVRHNDTSLNLLGPHAPAFKAGMFSLRRQQNMNQARRLKKEGGVVSMKLYVDFARDDHHLYLGCLRELKREFQASLGLQNYEQTVMDRVRGVLR